MCRELFSPENLEVEGEGLFVRQNSKMMEMKSLIGRSSGEETQFVFQGGGFVIVQPSENMRFGGQDQGGETPGSQQGGMFGGLLSSWPSLVGRPAPRNGPCVPRPCGAPRSGWVQHRDPSRLLPGNVPAAQRRLDPGLVVLE